jgi:LPXTG-motif cell wall-anchored protein
MRTRYTIMMFTAALGVASAIGGTAAADSSYPPGASTPTTVLSSAGSSQTEALARTPAVAGELPQTGSDSENAVKLAAGAVVAGAGLVVVAKRRRRRATA